MNSDQWNLYALQELIDELAVNGLSCPNCREVSKNIQPIDGSLFHCDRCNLPFSIQAYHNAKRRVESTGQTTLFRPIGEAELEKIAQSGFTAFPPRLEWQPIFYPVLTQDYADKIARDWNSMEAEHNYIGFVTRFQVLNSFLSSYEIQTAADKTMLEYWIPADDMDLFNENIAGKIEVIAEFRNGVLVPRL